MTDRSIILYCGVGLSSVAYCLVVFLAVRMPIWRKSALNWVWLITAGLYLLTSITNILAKVLIDKRTSPEFFYDHIIWFVKNYLILASASWLLAGAYASITDGEGCKVKQSVLFASLASLPGPLSIQLSIYFNKLPYFQFFSILFDVQLFMIVISGATIYAYDVFFIRSKSKKELDKSRLLLTFAVYLFCYWIVTMILKINFEEANQKEVFKIFYILSDISFFQSICRHFAVFILSLLHMFCIKENRYFVSRSFKASNSDSRDQTQAKMIKNLG